MSTIDEIKQKYPLFYQKPHYWIDAIEVECVKDYVTSHMQGSAGSRHNFTPFAYDRLRRELSNYKPLFKPQEGEQFLKDLEEAVRCAVKSDDVVHNENSAISEFFDIDDCDFFVEVFNETLEISISDKLNFNAAAYVDKLRELGYYL